MKVDNVPEGIWSKGQVDGSWPLLAHMEELLCCTLAEVPDGFFHDAILEVGVDPIKGKTPPLGTVAVLEGIVCKLSIVAVVVEDADAVLLGKVFKHALGFHHFFRGELGHEVNVLELGVVIDKDGGRGVGFLGKCPL
jgi:hypothetical protein